MRLSCRLCRNFRLWCARQRCACHERIAEAVQRSLLDKAAHEVLRELFQKLKRPIEILPDHAQHVPLLPALRILPMSLQGEDRLPTCEPRRQMLLLPPLLLLLLLLLVLVLFLLLLLLLPLFCLLFVVLQ